VVGCLLLSHVIHGASVGPFEEVPYYVRSFITPVLALWVLVLALQSSVHRGLLSSRIVVLGGSVSYSLYMTQFVWLHVWKDLFAVPVTRGWMALLYAIGLVAALLGAAFLTWRYIEEPCRDRMRRWVSATRDVTTGPRASRPREALQDGTSIAGAAGE